MCIHPKKKKSYSALSRLQAFANAVLADGMKKGRELVVGSISKEVVMDLQQKGITLETKDVTIDDAVIVKNQKGAVVASDRYWMVEKTLRNPTHIFEDTGQNYIVYVNTRAYSRGRALKVVVHPNYKSKGRTLNYLKSIGVIYTVDMKGRQFRKIK